MDGGTSYLVPQTDYQHLAKTALQIAYKVRVQLYAVNGNNRIRFHRGPVKIHVLAGRSPAQMIHINRGDNLHSKIFFCNPVTGKHFSLAFLRPVAMAPHSRDYIRNPALLSYIFNHGADNKKKVLNSSAPHSDRYPVARMNLSRNLFLRQLSLQSSLHIFQQSPVKNLLYFAEFWQRICIILTQ